MISEILQQVDTTDSLSGGEAGSLLYELEEVLEAI